ncbi:MAG: rRNA maturation RNase YbeY [Patescibacteria group bacterium]
MSVILTTLRTPLPVSGALLNRLARDILKTDYALSVIFIGDARSRRLNKTYRGKDEPTNVLAFPLSKKEGELYIALPYALKEARMFGHTPKEHILFLFIHGALHLKGFDHGPQMEKEEKRFMKKWS